MVNGTCGLCESPLATVRLMNLANHFVIGKFEDLVHAGEIAGGADIARPGEFLIDPSGTIRWRMVTENNSVRARDEQVLEAAKALP